MSRRIFYVEDDLVLARMTSQALTRHGFEVAHFPNLTDAKKGLGQAAFSHALLDMRLDDGNSLSLVGDLLAAYPDIIIVLLTGYASIATAVQVIKMGAHNYLAKPASIDEIINAFGESDQYPSISENSMSLKRLEWEKIQQALSDNHGNISLTAKQLNMHRRTLQRKLNKRPVQD